MRSNVYAGALLGFVACNGPAMAWGDLGHEVVCEIALNEVNPQTRSKIVSLIAHDPEFRAFGKSCIWPDHPKIRSEEHYVNVARSATKIESSAPCPTAAKCVVRAIASDMSALAGSTEEVSQLRLIKSLGHWVGDIHQPLHVSFEDDRGGGLIDTDGPCHGNLHHVWDTCILESKIGEQARDIAVELRSQITNQDRSQWVQGKIDIDTIIGWANDSLAVSLRPNVQYCAQKSGECWYSASQKIYPGSGPKKKVDVNDAYLNMHAPTVRERLKMAGVRLAAVLNTAFDQMALAEVAAGASSRTSMSAVSDRRFAPTVMVAGEQWQALLSRLDRLEGALQSVTQELKSLRDGRQPPRQ